MKKDSAKKEAAVKSAPLFASDHGCADLDANELGSCEALILAAGFSRRAGAFKMDFDFGGKTLLQRNVEAFLNARASDGSALVSRVVVVGGYRYERLEEALQAYEAVQLVKNPDYALGMYSSVLCGLGQLKPQTRWFFLCPGDYPLLQAEICETLAGAVESAEKARDFPDGAEQNAPEVFAPVTLPTYKGRSGHPLLLSTELVPNLVALGPEGRLDHALSAYKKRRVDYTNDTILHDVDSPQDYERLKLAFETSKNNQNIPQQRRNFL